MGSRDHRLQGSQKAQYPLIKDYALGDTRIPERSSRYMP